MTYPFCIFLDLNEQALQAFITILTLLIRKGIFCGINNCKVKILQKGAVLFHMPETNLFRLHRCKWNSIYH